METEHISKYLTVQQNSELQTQEQKPLKSGDEEKLSVAVQSRLIMDVAFEEVKEVLRLVMMKVGLRANNLPNDLEKLVLYEHIVSNFGGNRIEEIKLAFDMAIAGKLDVEVNCYENFSCYYFSTIMNAYRRWSSQAFRQVVKDAEPKQKIFTQEELDNTAREDAERQYQLYLKNHELRGLEINKAILVSDGLMDETFTVQQFFLSCFNKGFRHIYTKE